MGTIGRAALRRGGRIGAGAATIMAIALILASTAHTAEPTSQPPASCPPAQTEPATPTLAASASLLAPQQPYVPAPEEIVACVGASAILGSTFSHWAVAAEREDSPHSKRPTAPTRAVMGEVMGFLISSDWVLGEAAELGVKLSEAAVRRHFDYLRDQQFPRRSAYRAFLRSSGQTTADLLLRVRLSMLSSRIQRRVVGHSHNHKRQQQRLSRFVANFQRKWKARTYCEALYRVQDCGYVVPTL